LESAAFQQRAFIDRLDRIISASLYSVRTVRPIYPIAWHREQIVRPDILSRGRNLRFRRRLEQGPRPVYVDNVPLPNRRVSQASIRGHSARRSLFQRETGRGRGNVTRNAHRDRLRRIVGHAGRRGAGRGRTARNGLETTKAATEATERLSAELSINIAGCNVIGKFPGDIGTSCAAQFSGSRSSGHLGTVNQTCANGLPGRACPSCQRRRAGCQTTA